uniref:Epiphragmin n=1 Tax=Cernuella virgata TaxID=145650 RepID=A5Z1D6_9EUPU|nr:epiphragmin [Cernuella virgata]
MASTTWILSFCMLLSAVPFNTGLEFSVTRSLDKNSCANTVCSHDIGQQQKGSKISIRKITVSEVTDRTKFPLAYRASGENDIFIDPTRVNDIKGTSAITDTHAELRLTINNPTLCTYRTLECTAEVVDASGKKQVVRKTITPTSPNVNDDCSCSSIVFRLNSLGNRATGTSQQIYGQELNFNNLRIDLQNIENGTTELSENIARLKESFENLQVVAGERREADRQYEIQMNELRNKDSVLGFDIDDVRQAQQDSQDNIENLEKRYKDTEKKQRELSRVDRAQLDTISSLDRFDGVAANTISNFQKVDNDIGQRVNSLSNQSSSLAGQLNGLGENDNRLRANIDSVSARQTDAQSLSAELRSIDSTIDRSLAALDATNRNLEEDAAQIEYATNAKQGEINEIGEDIREVEAQNENLQRNDKSIDGRVLAFQSKDEEFDAALDDLEATSNTLQQNSNALRETNRLQQVKIETLRKTDTVQRQQLADFTVSYQVIREQITEINSKNSGLESGLTVAQTQQDDINSSLDDLFAKYELLENQITSAKITTQTETTTSLVLSSCTRNMPHDKSRVAVVVDGQHSAMCDALTDGGGYVIIANRGDGKENFNRNWADYRNGFGSPAFGEFFVGLDALAALSKQGYNDLRIDILDRKDKAYYARYTFSVDDEASKYRLHVSNYQGTAPNNLYYHDGMAFSTYDQDNDASDRNCAVASGGGNWFNDCYEANPFGILGSQGENGLVWKGIPNVAVLEIKIRKS